MVHPRSKPPLPTHLLSISLFLLTFFTSSALAAPSLGLLQAATTTKTLSARAVASTCACPDETSKKHTALFAVEAAMIPVLVLLSGVFAGLTLGYMSLDSTQLNVLAKTGSEKQKRYAKRVIPLRKDGHLLLITLLLANMIVNETLPVIADGVLGGGIVAVVISTVLVVIFSEIIPQSVCSRFGLAIGSAMVWPTQILIYVFYIVAWPVSRILEYLLGPHSGIVYKRGELKELIAMHASGEGGHGGDLDKDTITIVGATLDLQTKVVSDAMTPISTVFQLNINSQLDYETLGRVLKAGHSRIPVYEEIDGKRKIIGVLLTKQLILLDPEDAVPLRDIPMNPLPTVSEDLPLLQILNTFQEGRSHMAIVYRRKSTFSPLAQRSSKSRGSDSISDQDKLSRIDSDMEKGEVTAEQSMLRSLFHSKKAKKDDEEVVELDEKIRGSGGSRVSLSANSMLDTDVPVGVITLEDVLEELIGEEIYDETDQVEGHQPALKAFIPPEAIGRLGPNNGGPPPAPSATIALKTPPTKTSGPLGGIGLGRLGIKVGRSRSAPGKSRSADGVVGFSAPGTPTTEDRPQPPPTSSTALLSPLTLSTPTIITSTPSATTEAPTQTPESLSLIVEQNTSGSDTDDDTATEEAATPSSRNPPTRRYSAETPVARAPPLLSDAVLLQRGRRLLVAQGADPASLPNLRLAAPKSQPPSRTSTPTPSASRLIVPAQPVGATGVKKGSFKSPPLFQGGLPARGGSLPH